MTVRPRLIVGFVLLAAIPGWAEAPLPDLPTLDRGRLAGRYDLDFRASHYDYRALRVEGSGVAISLVKPTRAGLRVQVPPRSSGVGVGLCTKFGLRGDFEVIVAYEILAAPPPTQGPGIGVEVALQSATRWDNHVGLARRVAPKTGDATFTATTTRGGTTSIRSTAREGRLYLARAGSTVSLYAAEGTSAFRPVAEADFGSDNVMFVRLATRSEEADRGLDILWKDLTIRAEGLPRDPGTPDAGGSSLVWAIVGGGITLLIIAALLMVALRRRSRSR